MQGGFSGAGGWPGIHLLFAFLGHGYFERGVAFILICVSHGYFKRNVCVGGGWGDKHVLSLHASKTTTYFKGR